MAMVADKKRKQKFDPNVNKNNNWSKDSNKFGQKLLERMGWKEGKGLGRNENGLTDNVNVSYKNGSKGENEDNIYSKKRKGETLETVDDVQNTPSKKKLKFEASPIENSKTKKSKKNKNENLGLTNPAFEPLSSNITIKKHVLDTIIENDIESNNNQSEINITSEEKSTKAKKKITKKEINFEENLVEEPKPKKKKKKDSLALDNPNFNETFEEEKPKKKKKSKGLDNPALNDSELNEAEDINKTSESNFEVKRKKKKKSKGLDNLALNLDDSVKEHQPENLNNLESMEVKRKKKKSKGTNESNSVIKSVEENGIENVALEISDCDIMLNITNEPVKTTEKIDKNTPKYKTKNVRFSKTNQEYVIQARSPGDIDKRNELYDINTKVIQEGLKDLKKQKNNSSSTTIQNFDIASVDNIDFCDDGFSKSPKKFVKMGIDNRGFDVKAQNVQESVNSFTKTIDNYQAEVENGINEWRNLRTIKRKSFSTENREDFMVGEFNNSDGENELHEEGVKLRYKYAQFNKKVPAWARGRDLSATFAKKSYKHLIRGDIILGFRKTNLHEIDGYATKIK